jgi:hypothetical protein
MKFVMFTAASNFGVDEADEDAQMELMILQCNSVLNKNLMTSDCPSFYIYLPAHRFPSCSVCLAARGYGDVCLHS